VTRPLGSAPLEPPGRAAHIRGPADATEVIVYLDLACPQCAADWARLRELPLRLCVRHFPLSSKRPRSPALHAACEAAAALGGEPSFWAMWDSLLFDRAHQDDPHLWERAAELGIDLGEFDAERRSAATTARVRSDFDSGIRAGVTSTPTAFVNGGIIGARVLERLTEVAEA
jgi:protein-disulfide isomerase